LILIEPTFPGHVVWDKLWRFLLAGCSSVASAYLTFLSLRAIYEREGLNPDGQPAVMLEYFNIGISSVYCVRSLFRYMVPYCGIGSEPAAESDEEQPLLSKPNVVGMKETLEDTLKKIEKELLSAAKPKGPFV
jgi:hypothetical protein